MLNKYEELLEEAAAQNISVDENFPFHGNLKGLYVDQNIALSDQLETSAEKACILAEELGHHYTSVGNILPAQCRFAAFCPLVRLHSMCPLFSPLGIL